MRYGIFSDIHSNLEAMTEVAKAMKAEGAGEYLCLGDLVGYYANPNEVVELIDVPPVLEDWSWATMTRR